MRLIQAGPRDAKLVIVGEAPGRTELQTGVPFTGASGDALNRYLTGAGIDRREAFITNVVHIAALPSFESLVKPKPHPAFVAGVVQLRDDLQAIRPNVIATMGEWAMYVLTGKKGITKYRRSVLPCTLVPGLKVVPTFHPAAAFRVYELGALIALDMKKVASEMAFPEIMLPKREIVIWNGTQIDLVEQMANAEWLAVDIETNEQFQLICVGFSDSPSRALVVPAEGNTQIIRRLLESPAKKCGQNFGQFDMTVLEDLGFTVRNFCWDIMYSHHALLMESASGADELRRNQAPFRKGLAFQASIYTDQPFYKDDGKTWRLSGDITAFYRYNGLDAAVTYEIRQVHERELASFGTCGVFEHEMRMLPVLREMTRRGVRVDLDVRNALRKELEDEISRLQAAVDAMAGRPVNVKSPKQIAELVYGQLKLPKRYNESGSLTTNKDALVELAQKYQSPVLSAVLEIRRRRDLVERYLDAAVDADGRMRCLFDPSGTRTGRLASRQNIYGSGTNMQNIPPRVRKMFVPDPGKTFVYVDLSQAEARVVAYLAECQRLIDLFASGADIHKENAIRFFGRYDEDLRLTVKRIVHGSNYGEGPEKIVKVAAADGIKLDLDAVRRGQEAYFATYPEIKEVWWEEVRTRLRGRVLTTALGWKRQFFGRWDQRLFNEALAFEPQSIVGVVTQLGMLRVAEIPGVELLLNVHDAILCQVADLDLVPAIVEAMHVPIEIKGRTLIIPTEAKIGDSWDPNALRKATT